jgi:hypothetical protein
VTKERVGLYRFGIDGELWTSIEWSLPRNAWCIEDCCNRCLTHIEGIHGQEAKASTGIQVAKEMIVNGTMPSPETVRPRMMRGR